MFSYNYRTYHLLITLIIYIETANCMKQGMELSVDIQGETQISDLST